MKKAIQHTILSLFCFLGVIFASPGWFITHARPMSNPCQLTVSKTNMNSCSAADTIEPAPSILDGTARFACW